MVVVVGGRGAYMYITNLGSMDSVFLDINQEALFGQIPKLRGAKSHYATLGTVVTRDALAL